MGEEYVLPSGLAACEYYNEFSGASECRVPASGFNRNKALQEALEQLHKNQRERKELENLLIHLAQIVVNDSSRAGTEAQHILNQFKINSVSK